MRESYKKQLETLHTELIQMGGMCEEAIASSTKGLLDENVELREKALAIETQINSKRRYIEAFCVKLLLREQPVAGDLRQITAAQGIISNMERISDQAADIAELSEFMVGSQVKSDTHIKDMAKAAIKMLTDSVDSFVSGNLEKARTVVAYDDVVDGLFDKIKTELIDLIEQGSKQGEACLDLLMIAKYFERIGDHAENIAEWVVYSITGDRKTGIDV